MPAHRSVLGGAWLSLRQTGASSSRRAGRPAAERCRCRVAALGMEECALVDTSRHRAHRRGGANTFCRRSSRRRARINAKMYLGSARAPVSFSIHSEVHRHRVCRRISMVIEAILDTVVARPPRGYSNVARQNGPE
eukprot:3117849-Prymnesium_polylepis.2